MVAIATVTEQLRQLGVRIGDILLVHTSFRAVHPVEDGPLGLIQAMRAAVGDEGTLVMPSWSDDDTRPFDPATSAVAPDLGVTAEVFRSVPGVRRANHPFAFAALGPAADAILADRLPIPPHRLESPVGRVFECDGKVLLLGVDHDANSTVHLAELLAGVPYRVPHAFTVMRDGRPERVEYGENDHCCARFTLAGEWLTAGGKQAVGRVGNATARLARSRDIVEVARRRLLADPLIFLHPPSAGCGECDAARASVPL